jgi:mannosyltransferase OCH1-like enzyme
MSLPMEQRFSDIIQQTWKNAPPEINTDTCDEQQMKSWKFIYFGYSDDEAAKSISDTFQWRLRRRYGDDIVRTSLHCKKQHSNECGLEAFGHMKYECVFNVYQ